VAWSLVLVAVLDRVKHVTRACVCARERCTRTGRAGRSGRSSWHGRGGAHGRSRAVLAWGIDP
jgi:hypothetical protein